MAYLKDYQTGRYLLTVDGDYIKEYQTGKYRYKISGDKIVEYQSGRYLYKFDGFLSHKEIVALLAILFAV